MSASSSKAAESTKPEENPSKEENQPQQSQLGALEEDDEFEEFPSQGMYDASPYVQ